MPAPAVTSRAATPRIIAPPNTAAHSLANSEANSPRIMAELAPGVALPIPLPLHGTSGAANMLAHDTAACSGEHQSWHFHQPGLSQLCSQGREGERAMSNMPICRQWQQRPPLAHVI